MFVLFHFMHLIGLVVGRAVVVDDSDAPVQLQEHRAAVDDTYSERERINYTNNLIMNCDAKIYSQPENVILCAPPSLPPTA